MRLFMLFAGAVACAAQPTMIDYNTQVKNRPIVLSGGAWNFTSPLTVSSNGTLPTLTLTQSGSGNALTVNGTGLFNSQITGPVFAPRKLTLLDSSPSQFTSGWSLTSQTGPIANNFVIADPSATARFTWSLVQTGFFYNHAIFEPTATVDIGTLAVAAGSGATVRCTSCGVALGATAATGANTAIKGTGSGGGSIGLFGLNDSGYGGWFESNTGTALYVNGRSTHTGDVNVGGNAHIGGSLTAAGNSIFSSTTTFNGPVVLNGGCTGCSNTLTPPVTISGTTAGPLLTLTNFGAGNALTADGTVRATAHTGGNQKALHGEATDVNSFAVYGKNMSGYGGWFESATGRALYANGASTFNGAAAFIGPVNLNGGLESSTSSVFNSDTTFNGDVNMTCAGCSIGLSVVCPSCGIGLLVSGVTTAIEGYTTSTTAYPLNIIGGSATRLATFNNAGGGCNLLVAGLTCTSDRRLKQHIKPLAPALARVMQLKPVGFDWIKTGAHADGLIAQDVQKVFPLAVNDDDNGMLSLNTQQLVPYLIKAIQEQQAEIEELKRKLK